MYEEILRKTHALFLDGYLRILAVKPSSSFLIQLGGPVQVQSLWSNFSRSEIRVILITREGNLIFFGTHLEESS